MSGAVTTSRVFDAAKAAKARISLLTWPAHPRLPNQPPPAVTYDSSADHEANAELVVISSSVGDDATIISDGLPDRRSETVSLSVMVLTATGETDDEVVIDRLRDICNAIQEAVWDTDQTSPTGRSVPFGANGVKTAGVSQVSFSVFTDDHIRGYLGTAEVVYSLQFRI